MKSNVTIEVALEYSQVFNDNETLETLLSGFGKPHIMKLAAFLLGFRGSDSKFRDNAEFLKGLFSSVNADFAKEIFAHIVQLESEVKHPLMIYNHLSNLKLFEYAFNHLEDAHELADQPSEINLFKAYLFLNQENNRIANGNKYKVEQLPIQKKFAAISFVLSIANYDIINYDKRDVIVSQVIRSIYLFEFLEKNDRTKRVLQEFYAHYNCAHWTDFLKKILPVIFICYQRKVEGLSDITISRDNDFDNMCQFVDRLIIDDVDPFVDYDFINLRSKPLYKVQAGHYRVIFEIFLFELLHSGVYFKISNLNSQLPRTERISDFRGFYCDEFSEKYLLYSVLKRIYEKKHICFSGEEILALGIEAEPDYYIRNGNKIFLFESKDVLMPAQVKASYDYELLEEEVKKKLYFDSANGRIKQKAILQLINNIKRVLDKSFSFDQNYKALNAVVYPIIVLHHRHWEIMGLNSIIQIWFSDELDRLKALGYSVSNIKPITIIGIDTIILYQDLLIFKKFKLDGLIDEFHSKTTNHNKNLRFKNESHRDDYITRTIMPFSHYMALKLSEMKYTPAGPKLLIEKGMGMFEYE
jgi:hypothetical protein